MKQNSLFLLLLIFVFATGILSATVYFNREKIFSQNYQKTISATVTKAPEEGKTQPTLKQEPKVTSAPKGDEFANWITYQNDKFKYRLKYDPSWSKGQDCDSGNSCSFQGDVSAKGWPDISISKKIIPGVSDLDGLKTHLETTYSDAQIKKVVFSKEEIPAVSLTFSRSPQAYASEEYYFFHKGQILSIFFNDSDNDSAQRIYNYFLTNFSLIND